MKKAEWQHQFYKNYKFRMVPYFQKTKLLWKDKFETPRCERCPNFTFEWLWFGFHGECESDEYWEQYLWIYKYNNGDVDKARESWPWTEFETKKSTWEEY